MALDQRAIVTLIAMLALTGAFADGRIDFQSIVPLLILVSVVPAFREAGGSHR